MLIGAGDVYIASMYSTSCVASIGVANSFINPILLFGVGLMMGISPSLSIKRGEGESDENRLSSIIFYGLIIGVVLSFITLIWNQLLPYFGLEESLVKPVMNYNKVVAWSFPFVTIFQSMKEYLQARENVFFANLVAILAVGANLALNYIFVFGFGEQVGVGEIGLAYASVSIRFLTFISLLIYLLKIEEKSKIDLSFCKSVFWFSLPIAFMFFLEVTAFCLVGVLGGRLSVVDAATHNIVLTMSSVAFMVPLALSSAVAVKVGHAFGAKEIAKVKESISAAFVIISSYVTFSSFVFFFFATQLMIFSSSDEEVIKLGSTILFIVAIFQIVDGFQVVLNGILRGLEKVRIPALFVLIGFWLLGIPLGVYLTFYQGYGISGLWIGLAVALFIMALCLAVYLFRSLRELPQIFSKSSVIKS